jgi:hypothetical protein
VIHVTQIYSDRVNQLFSGQDCQKAIPNIGRRIDIDAPTQSDDRFRAVLIRRYREVARWSALVTFQTLTSLTLLRRTPTFAILLPFN